MGRLKNGSLFLIYLQIPCNSSQNSDKFYCEKWLAKPKVYEQYLKSQE